MNLDLTLVLPNINRNKTYDSGARRYKISVNGTLKFVATQDSGRLQNLKVDQGDVIVVAKHFGTKDADSVFRYVMGEETALLRNQQGKIKMYFADFQEDVLFVQDDIDWMSLAPIIAE